MISDYTYSLARFVMDMIAPVYGQLHAYRGHADVQAARALGRLMAGTDLVVIQHIFFSHAHWGQVGHDHVGATAQPFLPAVGRNGAKRRGGRQQHLRQHEPDEAQQI